LERAGTSLVFCLKLKHQKKSYKDLSPLRKTQNKRGYGSICQWQWSQGAVAESLATHDALGFASVFLLLTSDWVLIYLLASVI
jgi:hypothetical protein